MTPPDDARSDLRPAVRPSTVRMRSGRGRIALFGGSFNPAHEGHVHVSAAILQRLGADEVWWLVSPQNPLKSSDGMATLADRLTAARAIASHPRIRVTDLESLLGTTFTVDTVTLLKARFPQLDFVWIVGADNLIQLPKWRNWDRIFASIPVAVCARPTYSLRAMLGKAAQRYARNRIPARSARRIWGNKPPAWVFLPIVLHPASATEIRQRG